MELLFMMVVLYVVKWMDKVLLFFKMEISILVVLIMEFLMEKVFFNLKKVGFMKVIL